MDFSHIYEMFDELRKMQGELNLFSMVPKKIRLDKRQEFIKGERFKYGILMLEVEELVARLDDDPMDLDTFGLLRDAQECAMRIRRRWWIRLGYEKVLHRILFNAMDAVCAQIVFDCLHRIEESEYHQSFPLIPAIL